MAEVVWLGLIVEVVVVVLVMVGLAREKDNNGFLFKCDPLLEETSFLTNFYISLHIAHVSNQCNNEAAQAGIARERFGKRQRGRLVGCGRQRAVWVDGVCGWSVGGAWVECVCVPACLPRLAGW